MKGKKSVSSTNFWKVLTRLKKRYINLSPISDQISPAFEGQTTSGAGEVKKNSFESDSFSDRWGDIEIL